MANKYVSLSGSDSNNGLGPDASHATNKPWLTLEYAVDNISSGDVLYIAPGIYRDCITIGVTPSVETIISGDPLNAQGFKDGSGLLLDIGPVIITNLLTDDVSSATNSNTFDINGKSYLTIKNLWIENFSNSNAIVISSASTNINISDCYIFAVSNQCVSISNTAGTSSSITIDKCVISSPQNTNITITLAKHSSEYDSAILIKNSMFHTAGSAIYTTSSGTDTYFGTGVIVQNCTFLCNSSCFYVSSNYNASLTTKFQAKNCLMFGTYGVRQAGGTAGDIIVEDYNFICCSTPRTNVSTGGNSIAYGSNSFNRSIRIDCGQSQLWGFLPKSTCSPWNSSKTVGYGNDSTPTALTTDFFGMVRPSGCGVAAASALAGVGAIELHNYGVKDTGTKDAGDASIKLTGPGDHELLIPVDASSTTISIKVRYQSTTYGGTNYPQAILLDSEAFANISGNTETETATTSASDAWETLTFTAFTPSRKGTVRLRLINRGTGGDDVCWFDTLSVA